MDLSAVQQICIAAVRPMRDALGLWNEQITLDYSALKIDGRAAECRQDKPYRKVEVAIDPAKVLDEDDVLRLLRHELLHVVVGEFDVAGDVILGLAGIDRGTPASEVFDRVWTLAHERTVNQLESVLDGLGWTARALAGRETTCSGCRHTWRASAAEGTERVDCPRCDEHVTYGRTV